MELQLEPFLMLMVILGVCLANPNEDLDEEWVYEPREWSPDDPDKGTLGEYLNYDESFGCRDCNISTNVESIYEPQNFRQSNNFFEQTRLGFAPDDRQIDNECTQFRVDTRDAVICDKKRCDKLDFEWPTYSNQIAVIQTTKHGMRFHRVDFAFNRGDRELEASKFDIFAIFKPKPRTTTTTTTSTTTTTTTQTSNSDETTSKSPDVTSTSDVRGVLDQDNNTTQLITTFRLDTRRPKQTMLGFGGALSDSSCYNIKSLSSEMSKSLMEDYFGEKGIRYSIVRVSMGSSDFSKTPYTNNDKNASTKSLIDEGDDVEMNNFRLVDVDYEFKLPMIRQAIATSRQRVKLFASLWSPPIWMKNNSHIVHGYLKGDVYGPYYKGLAEYMIKWLEAYRRNGINFWSITGQNEPITGIKPYIFHNSLGITLEDYIIFYKLYLGPMMRDRGFGDVKLMIHDDNKGYAPKWVRAFLSDPEAAKYVDGVAFHWYMNDEYENLDFIAKRFPDKFIISSEACNGYLPFQARALPGNWERGVAYMYDIIKTVQKNSVGWVDWNMALDLTGGPSWAGNYLDAAIIVNGRRDEYYRSPMFYALGHFSRFVEPNSIRLDHRLANARYDYPLEAVAFLTPSDYVVIVALNSNQHKVPLRVIADGQQVRVVTLRENSFNTIIFKSKSRTTK